MALTKVTGDFIKDGVLTQAHLHTSHGITTAHIGEGSNLYFTNARVDSRIGDLSTSNLSEGSNLYYTNARADARIALQVGSNLDLSSKSTSDLSEGTNLYFTNARADARIAAASTSDLSEGTNLYYTDARVGSYLTTNSYATQSYVNTQVSNLVDSAPSTLDTLNELAAALGDDANFSTTVTNSIATKLPLAGGTLTGALNGTTATFSGDIVGQDEIKSRGQIRATGWWGSNSSSENGHAVEMGVSPSNSAEGYILSYNRNSSSYGDLNFDAINYNFNQRSSGTFTYNGANIIYVGQATYNNSNWDTAYGWGNHASAGYLTSYTETDTLATVTARGASTSTAVTLSNTGNHYNGHFYWDAYAAGGEHYPHFLDGSNGGGVDINWRLYTGSSSYLTHIWNTTKARFVTRVESSIDMRAPIFYDIDDTARYIDPTSLSRVNSLEIANTSDKNTPGALMKIGSDGFIFGGNNSGYESNSAQISAGYHTSNSLNFVGMGTGSGNRRMDFWAEGGFFIRGNIYDKDSTGYYMDFSGTSNLAKVIFNTSSTGLPRQITIKEDGDTENSMGSYPGAWTSALNIQSNDGSTYLWFSPLTSQIPRIQTNYGQLDFYTGNNTNRALHLSGTSARSSVFYDIDDTNSYFSSGELILRDTDPTIYFRDTDHNSAMIHVNSNTFYVLRGTTDSTSWTQVNSVWPLEINLTNNVATFGGSLHSAADVRAPIFYDRNNTAYYTDPASTSILNYAQIYNLYDAQGTRFTSPEGGVHFTSGSQQTGMIRIKLPSNRRRSNTMMQMTVNVYQYSTGKSFTIRLGGYNYSGGNWYNEFAHMITDQGMGTLNVRFGDDGTHDWICIGETNSTWSYCQVMITDFQGGYSGTTSAWGYGWGIDFVTSVPSGHTNTRATSLALTSNNVSNWGTDLYAPAYYDVNNTAYYVNPAGSSRMNQIDISSAGATGLNITSTDIRSSASSTWTGDPGGAGKIQYHSNRWYIVSDSSSNRIVQFRRNGSDKCYIDNDGRIIDVYDVRAYEYYDRDNTAYYVNPGSNSVMNTINGFGFSQSGGNGKILVTNSSNGYLYINNWIYVDGAGIFSSTNGAHFYPNTCSDYGAWRMNGNKNGWNGITFDVSGCNVTLMASTSTMGFYNDTDNEWMIESQRNGNTWLYYNGTWELRTANGYGEARSQMRAPIYYDTNNTGYYLHMDAGSNIHDISMHSATATHFGIANTSNGTRDGIALYGGATGGEPTYGLLFTGTSLGSHGGVTSDWATYFTMNDNTSRGWIFRRAGAGNSASITAGGLATFDNSVRSPIFYDSGNTNYYCDPASTSKLSTVEVGASGYSNIWLGGQSGNYFRFHTNNSHTYFDGNVGDINWRQGSSTRFIFYMTTANMTVNGTVTQYSDSRLKENIMTIDGALDKVNQLRGVYYNRTDINTSERQIGLVAQEVESVVPEVVHTADDELNTKSISYAQLNALLVEAIKELKADNDSLRARIETLENQ